MEECMVQRCSSIKSLEALGREGSPIRAVILNGIKAANVRWAAAHLAAQLILALAQVDDMSQQPIGRPFHKGDFDHHFGPHPMDPAKRRCVYCCQLIASDFDPRTY